MYQPKNFIAQIIHLHPKMNTVVNFQRFLFLNVTKNSRTAANCIDSKAVKLKWTTYRVACSADLLLVQMLIA